MEQLKLVQNLSKFTLPDDYGNSRSLFRWILWLCLGDLLVTSWLPGSTWRRFILRLYGAKIGKKVLIKPNVKIKFPWRLAIDNQTWIGESVWIDNLEMVTIGSNVCISQGAYLCTGNHDFKHPNFPYRLGAIDIENEAWICAKVKIAPNVRIGRGAVIELGSVLHTSVPPYSIFSGCPAIGIGKRPIT